MAISDERLSAYVDGELGAAERAEIEAAMSTDPTLAMQLARHRRLRDRLSAVHGDVLAESVPDALLAAVRRPTITGGAAGGAVVDLAEMRARRVVPAKPSPPAKRGWAALAAMLVGAAVIGAAVMRGPALDSVSKPVLIASAADGLTARGALAQALDRQLTAEPSADPVVKIGVSFRSADGLYCRTFQLNQGPNLAGVACRDASAWRIRATATPTAPAETTNGYRTAASALPAPVSAAVEAMIQGDALDARGEALAKAAGWKAGR